MPLTLPFLKLNYILLLVLALNFFACADQKKPLPSDQLAQNDSIQVWIDQSKSIKLPLTSRLLRLEKAQKRASQLTNDSLKANYFTKLSDCYLNLKDSVNFKLTNSKAIQFNIATQDSTSLGTVYQNLGAFYRQHNTPDSAFFIYSKAQQVFEAINDQSNAGLLLQKMARVQSDIGDYTNAENTIIKAIAKLKPLNEYKVLADCYALLADNAKLLEDYDRALLHYADNLEYLIKAEESPLRILGSKHNAALVNQKQGKHEKAISVFLEALAFDSMPQKNPRLSGRVLNNLGYSYLKMGQYDKLPNLFLEAIKIQDSINDLGGKSSGALKLAEYYLTQNDSSNALANLKIAKNLAFEVGNHKYVLNILKLLPRADPKNGSEYLQEYVALSDSLLLEERRIRDKFARIQFETDEFIAKNKVLTRENQLWTGIAAALLLLGLASYIIINQRVKNRTLRFRQQQQAKNQEVFNLMLAQGEKVEEGKKMEQKRVSEELHDGVLGKMLGARMMLIGLNKKMNPEAVAERAKAISILQGVEGEIRSISHELSHAAYQKIHNFILSVKDLIETTQIASKINIDLKYSDELDWDALGGEIKINLYRIVQESLQNSVKHAACENIHLSFFANETELIVNIIDDGKGFVQKRGKKGIGMRNMSSRIKKINGTWDINSKVGQGTTVIFIIPIVLNTNENTTNNTAILEPKLQEL